MNYDFVIGLVSCSLVVYAVVIGCGSGLSDVHKMFAAAIFLWIAAWSVSWFFGRGLPDENLSRIAGMLMSTPVSFTLSLAVAVYAAMRRRMQRHHAAEVRG